MAFKMRGFTPFTKINDDDKKINAVIVNDNSNKSDTISNDKDKNVCLPFDINCPKDRERRGREILEGIKPNKNKNVEKVTPKKIK